MGAIWGNKLKLSIFGESHGAGIGINIDGIPAGVKLDREYIEKNMQRRAPGKNKLSTQRKESDNYEILSGVYNEKTTGAPLCILIRNEDKHSKDYLKLKEIMRPSHSDYPAHIKFNGNNDIRGGGHFSGRITAPLVFAGSLARQILKDKGIVIVSCIKKIGKVEEKKEDYSVSDFENLENKDLSVFDDTILEKMKTEIEEARKNQDSVGGIIECIIFGLKAGIGNPFFDSLESTISHLAFSIPAVKGIEFGKGFEFAQLHGSNANDEYYYSNNEIKTYSNNNGGILGGISTGMPIVFRVVIKPTPSISKKQRSINIDKKENCILEIEGRHDPCIVPRVGVVLESIAALAILDQIL